MAKIVPSDLTRLALSGAHEPEIETLAILRDRLPDEYTVFHGVHWTRQYKGRTLYGEIDFVVMNQAVRVLCIEQKNGRLDEAQGQLFKDYGDSRKNVGDQILRSIDNIRDKFAYQIDRNPRLEVEYLIYCPDYAVKQLAAAAVDAERVVDARSRGQLAARIQSILPPEQPDPVGWADKVDAFFRQTFEVVPDVHAHIGAQEKNYTRLSHGLLEVLANIEMDPLRPHVLATAGNGKTLVARHFFDQCLDRGNRPLLLCFNRPLAERLKHLVARGGMVETWYGFCGQFLKSRGVQLDFEVMRGDPDFWLKAGKQVEEQALANTPTGDWRFDTLIVDEASQLKTTDACIAIERVTAEGRLVAAGDHAQLGPIVNGIYPDPPDGEPVLHRSVLDLLLERPGRPGAPLCQLLENWRMNETLTDASRAIYGPSFRCANDEIANRRLRLRAERQGFVGICCDPDYPLIIVAMEGIQAAQTNDPEADLVTELAIALREDMEGVQDDQEFWKDHLFIISPHHSQIGAIRRQLATTRDWAASPFVDTVDKMQGQEAEAVLVSYGVSDPEYTAMEAEFIYGRNRLNVAITRARCKSIVFLPQPLLDGSPELLNDETVAEGLTYMRDLVALARRCDTPRDFPLNENVTARVFRVGRATSVNLEPLRMSEGQRDALPDIVPTLKR